MAARRLVILLLVLLVVSTLAATLVPPPDQGEETTSQAERTTGTGAADRDERRGGRHLSRTVDASERAPRRVPMRLGDQLALTVRSGTADQAEIPGLGLVEDVDPDAPARFDLLPQHPGTFEVRLLDARQTVARIRVRRR